MCHQQERKNQTREIYLHTITWIHKIFMNGIIKISFKQLFVNLGLRADFDAFTVARNKKVLFHVFPKKINVIKLLSQYILLMRTHSPGVVVVGFVGSIKWINHVILYPAFVSRNITVAIIYGTVWWNQIIYQIYLPHSRMLSLYTSFIVQQNYKVENVNK